jgi:hypothetical protein
MMEMEGLFCPEGLSPTRSLSLPPSLPPFLPPSLPPSLPYPY